MESSFSKSAQQKFKYKIDGEASWHKIGGVEDLMDCKKNTWLVGVTFAEYEKSSVSEGHLKWVWKEQREYAECYNLAEADEEITISPIRRSRRCDHDDAPSKIFN